ncbi:MAG: translation elongation factor-like protein [Candidatus Bathyarchaeota archaeon]
MSKPLVKVGEISHYYSNIGVAVVELADTLKVGDSITVAGATTDFTQVVRSMQIEHKQVEEAGAGDSIGLKVQDRVRKGDVVYRTKI